MRSKKSKQDLTEKEAQASDKVQNQDITTTNSKEAKTKKPKKEKAKKKLTKGTIVSLVSMFVLGISSGVFAGNWFVANFIGAPPTDYSAFSMEQLVAGNDDIARDYEKTIPTSATAWKSFIAAEYNALKADKFDVLSNGEVDTIVTQTVYSRKKYDGETITVEQFSAGMVDVALKYVYKPALYNENDSTTLIANYKGSLGKTTSLSEHLHCPFNCKHGNKTAYAYGVSYSETPKKMMTEDDYEEAMGDLPMSAIGYIVSQHTVLTCSEVKTTGTGADARYNFTMQLNPASSVIGYVKQMKTVSGLSDYPNFTDIKLSVSLRMIDGKVMFDCVDVLEKYSVKYGALTPKCTGSLHQRFLFNEECDFPQ